VVVTTHMRATSTGSTPVVVTTHMNNSTESSPSLNRDRLTLSSAETERNYSKDGLCNKSRAELTLA